MPRYFSGLDMTAWNGSNPVPGGSTGAGNVTLGAGDGSIKGVSNVSVGRAANQGLTGGAENTTVGTEAGPGVAGQLDGNVVVGFQTGKSLGTASQNVLVGRRAGESLTQATRNVFVGPSAGATVTTATDTVIIGGHTGGGPLVRTLVLSDGAGNVRLRWDDDNNGVQTLDDKTPVLTTDNTMAFQRGATAGSLRVWMRSAGVVKTLDLAAERPLGTPVTTGTLLLGPDQRNRFTVVKSTVPVTVTLVAYTDIVLGAEHEFVHHGTSTLTFAAGSGITIRSVAGRLAVTANGAVVAKFIGDSTFALIGALE